MLKKNALLLYLYIVSLLIEWAAFACNFVSVPIGLYGFQHYLSMLGSLILIPLVIVPAMGGDHVST